MSKMGKRWPAAAGLAAAALMIAACGSSASPSSTTSGAAAPASGGNTLKTTTIGGATVLTNAKGFTVYWFGPDTATTSNCTGSCAPFWPPGQGSATPGPGGTRKLGTIQRSAGHTQATHNREP